MNKAYYCGRRPKSDAFDDTPDPTFLGEEDDLNKEEEELLEEEVDEEVDFDKPSFGRKLCISSFIFDRLRSQAGEACRVISGKTYPAGEGFY